jgi:Protein of unknown function (DUF4089)
MVLKRAKSRTKRKLKRSRPAATRKALPQGAAAKRDPLDSFVDAAARALDLAVEPAWKGAVKTNLEVTFGLARTFADFPLPDDAEPAPVFVA